MSINLNYSIDHHTINCSDSSTITITDCSHPPSSALPSSSVSSLPSSSSSSSLPMVHPSPSPSLSPPSLTASSSEWDDYFMIKCIDEAKKCTPSNAAYSVGAILVNDSTKTIMSTGYSRELPGNTHAEECALIKYSQLIHSSDSSSPPSDSLPHINPSAFPLPSDFILYTTMEPCSIRLSGKRGCASLIKDSGIRTVVVGAHEPTLFVRCEGSRLLSEAGIVVRGLNGEGWREKCLAMNSHLIDIKKELEHNNDNHSHHESIIIQKGGTDDELSINNQTNSIIDSVKQPIDSSQ